MTHPVVCDTGCGGLGDEAPPIPFGTSPCLRHRRRAALVSY
jgi:hypothetical protein